MSLFRYLLSLRLFFYSLPLSTHIVSYSLTLSLLLLPLLLLSFCVQFTIDLYSFIMAFMYVLRMLLLLIICMKREKNAQFAIHYGCCSCHGPKKTMKKFLDFGHCRNVEWLLFSNSSFSFVAVGHSTIPF